MATSALGAHVTGDTRAIQQLVELVYDQFRGLARCSVTDPPTGEVPALPV